ncbi:NUDIX domain-containing protein [Hirschia litorea]|uniref:NUDIX domain-containing protein n=1 Tax=Hirschia litorea TaxID=1199156 RepID=A0ABW2ILF6_9PROT
MASSKDKQSKPPHYALSGWKIKSSQTKYENAWIRMGEYKAVAPTGVDATYGLVSFKNLAVGMLALEADGSTYLVGQHRFALGQYSWEVPEGGGPMNEDPILTAKRELSEEIHMQAREWMTLFTNMHLSNSVTDERAFGYIATGLSPCHAHAADDVEALQIWRLPVGQAVQMVVKGQITDALSLAILLKADHLWRTGQLPENIADAFAAGQI